MSNQNIDDDILLFASTATTSENGEVETPPEIKIPVKNTIQYTTLPKTQVIPTLEVIGNSLYPKKPYLCEREGGVSLVSSNILQANEITPSSSNQESRADSPVFGMSEAVQYAASERSNTTEKTDSSSRVGTSPSTARTSFSCYQTPVERQKSSSLLGALTSDNEATIEQIQSIDNKINILFNKIDELDSQRRELVNELNQCQLMKKEILDQCDATRQHSLGDSSPTDYCDTRDGQ